MLIPKIVFRTLPVSIGGAPMRYRPPSAAMGTGSDAE